MAFIHDLLATKQWTATTEVRLRDGHEGTKQSTTKAAKSGRT